MRTSQPAVWLNDREPLPAPSTTIPVALAGILGAALLAVPIVAEVVLAEDQAHLATRLALVASSVAAALVAFGAARRQAGSLRWGWSLLTAAAVLWSLSNLIAAYSELVEGRILPVPSGADIPAALAALIATAGILGLLGAVLPSAARMRALLDGLLIAGTLLFVSWDFVLKELVESSGAGPERVLALGYPVADLTVLSVLLVSLSRLRLTGPWLLLLCGFGLHGLSRATSAYLEVARASDLGLEAVLWIAGTISIAAAALPGGATFERRRAAPRAGTTADILIPCIPLAIALVLGGRRLSEGSLGTFLLMNAGFIVVLLVARQLLAQVEYLTIYRQLEASVTHGVEVLTVIGPGGVIVQQSGPVERALGYRAGELVGTPFRDLVHPQGRDELLASVFDAPPPPTPPSSLQMLLKRSEGDWVLTEATVADLTKHPDVGGFLVSSRDAGKKKSLDSQLSPETLRDPLTGLPNRVQFLDRLNDAVRRSALTPEILTVVIVDLDGFTQLNDTFGHATGDQVLVQAASRLRSALRRNDMLARLGADEFGILFEHDDASPRATAERVLGQLREPMQASGRLLTLTANAGVATGSFSIPTGEELLRSAGLALNQSKGEGRGGVSIFRRDLHLSARNRVEIESDLRNALERSELLLHYQPIVDLPSGRIAGAEALVRWDKPGKGLVSPGEFMAIAEESPLAVSLGQWILQEACRSAREFQSAYVTEPAFFVAVNLSGRQLADHRMADHVLRTLVDSGLPPSALVLEIPQTALADEGRAAIPTLETLRYHGVKVAIDDFGSGWSSLGRLRDFPVDKVKIDRPFIADVTRADDEAPLLTAMLTMAQSMGVATIAEGVETAEQLSVLWRLGCQSAQGFGVYPPAAAPDLLRILGEHELMLEAAPLTPLSEDARGYIEAVSAATKGETPLVEVAGPLLRQLVRITGGDQAALTRYEPRRPEERVLAQAQRDQAVRSVPDTASWSLRGSPSEWIREGGASFDPQLRMTFPDHPLVHEHGATQFLGSPVTTADGTVFGTLMVLAFDGGQVDPAAAELVRLMSRLLGTHPEVAEILKAAANTRRIVI
jgi:diguanylate cyclase (GGDEF)-like protein/PAS domain S-box-containing protein